MSFLFQLHHPHVIDTSRMFSSYPVALKKAHKILPKVSQVTNSLTLNVPAYAVLEVVPENGGKHGKIDKSINQWIVKTLCVCVGGGGGGGVTRIQVCDLPMHLGLKNINWPNHNVTCWEFSGKRVWLFLIFLFCFFFSLRSVF